MTLAAAKSEGAAEVPRSIGDIDQAEIEGSQISITVNNIVIELNVLRRVVYGEINRIIGTRVLGGMFPRREFDMHDLPAKTTVRITRKLTAEEISEAQRLYTEWDLYEE